MWQDAIAPVMPVVFWRGGCSDSCAKVNIDDDQCSAAPQDLLSTTSLDDYHFLPHARTAGKEHGQMDKRV